MSTMQREYTWVKPVVKGQTGIPIKVLKDTSNRHNRQCQETRFETFDYTNDAIFETFRDHPRKKQLYRKHKDIAKDYERKVKFYRSCQRWYTVESKRQMHNVGDRFCKLLKHTFETTKTKSSGLRNSYNLWFPNRNTCNASQFDKTSNKDTGNQDHVSTDIDETGEDNERDVNSPPKTNHHEKRLHSLRSVSVDNIPAVEERYDTRMIDKIKLNEELAKYKLDSYPYIDV